jgi:hypothetical protein
MSDNRHNQSVDTWDVLPFTSSINRGKVLSEATVYQQSLVCIVTWCDSNSVTCGIVPVLKLCCASTTCVKILNSIYV